MNGKDSILIFVGKNFASCLLGGLVITGLGIYGIFGITFAMQPDVIDYSEYQENSSIAGLIAAFQGFFVKGGMGLTGFIIGAFLKNGGYVLCKHRKHFPVLIFALSGFRLYSVSLLQF